MSAPYLLRTLDTPALLGPDGPVDIEPRAFALLTLLALADEAGVTEEELLLRLTPELTPARGHGALKALSDTLAAHLGEGAITRAAKHTRLLPGHVRLDVRESEGGTGAPAGARFLRGFRLAGSPEFDEWVAATGARVTPLATAQPDSSRWRHLIPLLGAAAVVLAVVTRARGARSTDFVPGGLVVLADLDNATGDTLFDAGLTLAMGVALEQSGRMSLLSRARIRQALERAGVPGGDSMIDLDRAREAAAREGVRYVIAPRIAPLGSGYRMTATIVDAMEDRLVTEASATAEGRAGVLPALDQVLREIRATLGEDATGRDRLEPLPLVTTPSLEALRSYARGVRAWRDAEYDLAEQYWHRALTQDTGFAMAYGSLSNAKSLTHDRDSANYYYEMAATRSHRLTEWEQLRLRESWASARGDRDSAVKIAAMIAERFPNAVSHYNYGTVLLQADRCEEAQAPFERALQLDSTSYVTHLNLATCARRAGTERESLRHYEQAAAIWPAAVLRGNVAYEFAGVLVGMGLVDSARRHFERMASQTALFDRTLGLRGLAFLALSDGRDVEAAHHFETTIEIARQQRAQLSLARGYMYTALTYSLGGHLASSSTAFERMLEIIRTRSLAPQMLALAGWSLCRAGRTRDAVAVLDRLRQQSNGSEADRGAETFLAGTIALAQDNPARADSMFAAGPPFVQPVLVSLLRARALAQSGRQDSAARLRSEASKELVFGSESHYERILQDRVSARTPTDRR